MWPTNGEHVTKALLILGLSQARDLPSGGDQGNCLYFLKIGHVKLTVVTSEGKKESSPSCVPEISSEEVVCLASGRFALAPQLSFSIATLVLAFLYRPSSPGVDLEAHPRCAEGPEAKTEGRWHIRDKPQHPPTHSVCGLVDAEVSAGSKGG